VAEGAENNPHAPSFLPEESCPEESEAQDLRIKEEGRGCRADRPERCRAVLCVKRRLIAASIQWAERIMTRIDDVFGK
jgi:hypothetical protein